MPDATDYIAEAITEQWGDRCPDFAEGCACCEAWAQYDDLKARVECAEKALEPFAEAGRVIGGPFGDALFPEDATAFMSGCTWRENDETRTISWGRFRAARAHMEKYHGR